MNALLVFVEGGADACFVLRSLGQVAGAEFLHEKPVDLPTPFGAPREQGRAVQRGAGLILRWHDRAPLDRSLAESAEGHEPVFQAAARVPSPETLVLVVRMGGDRKASAVNLLLDALSEAMTPGVPKDIAQAAVAFVFDADTPGHYRESEGDCVALRTRRFADEYPRWLAGAAPAHGGWTRGGLFPMGLFVLHDGAARSGTLESLLEPPLRDDPCWRPRLDAAELLLGAHQALEDAVATRPADRAKARLTIAGQFSNAGESLAQILKRGDPRTAPCVPHGVFAGPESQGLVRFLLAAPWA